MAQFTQHFYEKILQMEGGYQANSADTGNYACGKLIGTNRGISAVALQEYLGRCPTVDDSKGIDDAFAWDFYNWYFGKKSRYLEVNDQETAELLMNNHMGAPKYAAQAIQRAMNRFGYGLAVDGIAGSKTIAAINDAVRQNKVAAYNGIREEWIAHLNTTNLEFRSGLLNRMANYFPPLSGADQYAAIESGSAAYQAERAQSIVRGAFSGDAKDIVALVALALGLLALVFSISSLVQSPPALT